MKISWKVKALDNVLGPIEGGVLTLIFGDTGSGKTTLTTYYPIVRIVDELGGKLDSRDTIFVVDTDGGFEWERFKQIVDAHGLDFEHIKQHIKYYNVTEFNEQHELITKKIPQMIRSEQLRPLIISVDPMTAIYRGIILRTELKYRAAVISTYTGKLDLQLVMLRTIAVDHDIPVFVSTWPSSDVGKALQQQPQQQPDTGIRFIGGRQMGFIPKIIAEIKILDRYSPDRQIILFKARGKPPGLKGYFRLSEYGVSEVEVDI